MNVLSELLGPATPPVRPVGDVPIVAWEEESADDDVWSLNKRVPSVSTPASPRDEAQRESDVERPTEAALRRSALSASRLLKKRDVHAVSPHAESPRENLEGAPKRAKFPPLDESDSDESDDD